MSHDDNAYQRMNQIEIGPLLEAYDVSASSVCSPIDQRIMLADRMAERSALVQDLAVAQEELEELREEIEDLKSDLEKAEAKRKEAEEERDRTNAKMIMRYDAPASERGASELADLRAEYDAFQTFVGKKAKKTLEAWKARKR